MKVESDYNISVVFDTDTDTMGSARSLYERRLTTLSF